MRRCPPFIIAGLAGAVAIWATGFPRRLGLTRSQAALSLPGDLLAPGADVVVDRAVLVKAPVDAVWAAVDAAFHPEDEADVLVREPGDCIITRVALPGLQDEEDRPSVAILALLPQANDCTRLHLRERHRSTEEVPAWLITAALAVEAPQVMLMLRDIKKAAEQA